MCRPARPFLLSAPVRALLLASGLVLTVAPGVSLAGAKPAEHRGGSITFVHLPGLTTNVLRATGRWGVVTLEAGLDIPDEKLRLRAQHSIPLLLDGYTRALAGIGPSVRPGSQPDLDRVSTALQKVTDQVLGKPGAVFLVGSVIVN